MGMYTKAAQVSRAGGIEGSDAETAPDLFLYAILPTSPSPPDLLGSHICPFTPDEPTPPLSKSCQFGKLLRWLHGWLCGWLFCGLIGSRINLFITNRMIRCLGHGPRLHVSSGGSQSGFVFQDSYDDGR